MELADALRHQAMMQPIALAASKQHAHAADHETGESAHAREPRQGHGEPICGMRNRDFGRRSGERENAEPDRSEAVRLARLAGASYPIKSCRSS
jgi:hypothetical protein